MHTRNGFCGGWYSEIFGIACRHKVSCEIYIFLPHYSCPAPAPERGRERTCVGYDSSMHFISGILLITLDLIDIFLVNLFVFFYWRCVSIVGFFQYIRHLKNFFIRLKWIKPC